MFCPPFVPLKDSHDPQFNFFRSTNNLSMDKRHLAGSCDNGNKTVPNNIPDKDEGTFTIPRIFLPDWCTSFFAPNSLTNFPQNKESNTGN